MSTVTTVDSHKRRPLSTTNGSNAATLRVWPAVVLTIAFWVFLYANHTLELSAATRFVSRMLGFAVAFLLFLSWWLSRSKITWRDRLLAVAVTIACGAIALQFADKTINWFAILLTSFPFVMTVWTAWLFIARSFEPRVQRIGFCVAMLFTMTYFTLIRWDGLDAMQRAEMNWRWTPTKEQEFLTSRGRRANEAAKSDTSAKAWTVQPGDCPEFRGPQRDGVLTGVSVVADWNEHPPKQMWLKRVGPGWSGMIVVDGHVVTQEQRDKVESVVCYDAATGNELWAHDDAVRFEEALAGAGPRGTPTFAGGRIYALGGKGTLNCLKPETGGVIWSHDIIKDAGVAAADLPQWGYSVSPLVVDGLVVVFAGGGSDKSVLAYRADDGKLAWTAAGGKQSYSSPQLATLGGQKQIVMHDTTAIRVLNIADGKELWNHPNGSEMSLPMLQPHVVGPSDLVVAITPGMARLEVTRQLSDIVSAPRWETNKLRPDFSDFVIHKGSIYGLNDGILCCLDLETGNQLWKKSRLGHGQMLLLADQDVLLVSSDKGEIILVSVNREGSTELGRFQAIDGKTWNGPVLVGNRVFLRNAAEMAAYEINVQPSKPQSPASAQPTNTL
jgi:outer membrane protein assembly factor BamB